MEPTAVKQTRVQRSASAIMTLLREQDQSNVTIREFCEAHDIREQTFYNWRKKYDLKIERKDQFIALQIEEGGSKAGLFAEIELPGKAMIRLFCRVDPSYFKALL